MIGQCGGESYDLLEYISVELSNLSYPKLEVVSVVSTVMLHNLLHLYIFCFKSCSYHSDFIIAKNYLIKCPKNYVMFNLPERFVCNVPTCHQFHSDLKNTKLLYTCKQESSNGSVTKHFSISICWQRIFCVELHRRSTIIITRMMCQQICWMREWQTYMFINILISTYEYTGCHLH